VRLSGGEKSRVVLAQLLVRRPSLLLLDEPTNHLDLAGIEWLEGYLGSYQGSVILVSHDRYLLDRLVGDIVEIETLALSRYPGCNYSAYVEEKEKRTGKQQKLYDQQQAEIERLKEFIRRNIAGQKTRQAQSRRKVLDRLERTDRPVQAREVKLRLTPQERGGNDVLRAEGLSKAYKSKTLFADLSFVLRRKERVGVLGPNGSGKTTLLKILIGAETPDAGRVRMGRNIQAGYYDQVLDGLDKDTAILDEVWQLDPSATREQMRTFLGRFLFSGDEVFRPIRSLSGGEQSRVALAKLILSGTNLLVLDEPTNHLDIPSRIALEEALSEYQGSVVVVSHDRYFLDKIVQRILYLRDGAANLYEGNYSDFERRRKDQQPSSAATK
jgi:ATP-binding cassette subfamily F protein 3